MRRGRSTPFPAIARPAFAALGLALALAGCQPVYETGYRFEPPADGGERAATCVASCAAAQEACLKPARAEFAACQGRASMQQDQCRAQSQIQFEICQGAYAPEGLTCIYQICHFQQCDQGGIAACEADYRACFAGCGGKVVEEPRCVANCPS
jgi:hypothetical protein